MELSEEMREAIRILREDGQIGAYNKMTESHQALIARLDEAETRGAERDARWEEKIGQTAPAAGAGKEGEEAPGGTPGSGEGGAGGEPGKGVPTPPPVKDETPPADDGRPKRKKWYESDVYSRGD